MDSVATFSGEAASLELCHVSPVCCMGVSWLHTQIHRLLGSVCWLHCGCSGSVEAEVSWPSQLRGEGCHCSHKDPVDTEACWLLLGDKTSLSTAAVCRPLPPRIAPEEAIDWNGSSPKNKSWCDVWLVLYHSEQPYAHTCDPIWRVCRAKES